MLNGLTARVLRHGGIAVAVALVLAVTVSPSPQAQGGLRVSVSFPASASSTPLDGRLLLMVSAAPDGEPRFQINDSVRTQQVFGLDVEGLKPGQPAVFDASVPGYPADRLTRI